MMQRLLLAAVLVLLVMCSISAAEPKHVDGGWQRSDEVSQETPPALPPEEMPPPTVAPPETATEPEATAGVWAQVGYMVVGTVVGTVVGVVGLFVLATRLRPRRARG